MIIVLKGGVEPKQEQSLIELVESYGIKTSPIHGSHTTVIGLIGDTSVLDVNLLQQNEIVERVMKVQEPYKKANRKFHPDNTVIDAGNVKIGGKKIAIMAGPCSIESEEQLLGLASVLKPSGAHILRGGAFKPRTSPYSFQGMRTEGMMILKRTSEQYKMPVVSEITNQFYIDIFEECVDIIQVGARNMQNFELLKALGEVKKPILLKRGFSNTLEELLMSAEYIMSAGNENVILCERGIRTFENYTRNTLDISAIPALKKLSHLPVVVDPSHACGISWMVEPLALAAISAGADGLIIEVHNDPKNALSDGAQSLTPEAFDVLCGKMRLVSAAVGREI